MYKGIENEIEFSGSQIVGATFAAQYMEAVSWLQKFENNVPIDQNLWSTAQKEKKIELMEVVQHYLSMPLILEFNKLIADLQKHKKDQAQKRVTFWEDKHQCLASMSRDAVLNLPPLSPQTETPSKTTSGYHNTGGQEGGTQCPGDPPRNPTDPWETRPQETEAAGNQSSQGGSNPT